MLLVEESVNPQPGLLGVGRLLSTGSNRGGAG